VSDELGFVHRWAPAPGATTTVLALHGTGGDENDLLPLVAAVAPGTHVLSPRGRVVEMGAPRFFKRRAEGVFDLDDLVARSHELADFVGAAAETYGFDSSRVIGLGYSNGANVASSMMMLRPEILAGAALLRPMKPFEPDDVGAEVPDLAGRRVLTVSGARDPIVPPGSAEALVELLTRAGAEVSAHASPAGHELIRADLELVARWLGKGDAG
jgi:phospholipase/carboxylesterase